MKLFAALCSNKQMLTARNDNKQTCMLFIKYKLLIFKNIINILIMWFTITLNIMCRAMCISAN